MTETATARRPVPPSGAMNGSRMLALLLVGLGIGIVGTVTTLSALARRANYGDGLMAVLQAEFGQLRQQARRGAQCTLDETERARSRLALLATDIPRAFPTAGSAMHKMSDELLAVAVAPIADCAALPGRIATIDEACKACHSQFR